MTTRRCPDCDAMLCSKHADEHAAQIQANRDATKAFAAVRAKIFDRALDRTPAPLPCSFKRPAPEMVECPCGCTYDKNGPNPHTLERAFGWWNNVGTLRFSRSRLEHDA